MSCCLTFMSGISEVKTSRKGKAMDMSIDYFHILLGCIWHIGVLIVVISFIERRQKNK